MKMKALFIIAFRIALILVVLFGLSELALHVPDAGAQTTPVVGGGVPEMQRDLDELRKRVDALETWHIDLPYTDDLTVYVSSKGGVFYRRHSQHLEDLITCGPLYINETGASPLYCKYNTGVTAQDLADWLARQK